jgi:hypothetical protein
MKTIREYIDQLDEISRRDFIKGAGAAAITGAAGGANAYNYGRYPDGSGSGLIFNDQEWNSITNGLELYIACKKGVITDQSICSGIKQALGKIANLKGGKDALNFVYPQKMSHWEQITQLPVYNQFIRRLQTQGKQYIDEINSIVEFQ